MSTILLVILVIILLGGLPAWGYHPYGWYPSGGAGLLVLILLVLLLAGRI